MGERRHALREWVERELGLPVRALEPASSDASFRRYFRVTMDDGSWIVMDAPPDREDIGQYVRVARAFRELGLNVPEIIDADMERGFLLLTDLGTRLYLDELSEANVERLYGDALGALAVLQVCGPRDVALLPPYDHTLLMQEMELFREWYLHRHLGHTLSGTQSGVLDESFALLAGAALEQPQVCVHRDYHSRNLMVCSGHNPGILDFQDAVVGPVTYDLVSLLRDCYIDWPRERVEEWAMGYYTLAVQSGVLPDEHEDRFLRWFDLMGVQRHLKATGIFSRLNLRDGKPGYLHDIPRTLRYVMEVSARYDELTGLRRLLGELGAANGPGSTSAL